MAQNIILMGASFEDVPAVALPKAGGGTALFSDTSNTTATADDVRAGKTLILADGAAATGAYVWSWMGDKAELISTPVQQTLTLADTTFPDWTASTTAKAIKATVNAGTFSADMEKYAYFLRWRWRFDAAYNDDATLKVIPIRLCAEIWQAIYRRPNTLANLVNEVYAGAVCSTTQTVPVMTYYNSSGTATYAYSASYGFYPAATAATFSSATAAKPTVTIKTPTVNVRCSTTYFATARKADIDSNNSRVTYICELYRTPLESMQRILYEGVIDLFNNPIQVVTGE